MRGDFKARSPGLDGGEVGGSLRLLKQGQRVGFTDRQVLIRLVLQCGKPKGWLYGGELYPSKGEFFLGIRDADPLFGETKSNYNDCSQYYLWIVIEREIFKLGHHLVGCGGEISFWSRKREASPH